MGRRKAQLSEQQVTIASLAASGLTNKEIASQLQIGPRAVETQIRRMREKLGTSNKTETIAVALAMLRDQEGKELESLAHVTQHMPQLLVAFDRSYAVIATNTEAEALLAPARQSSVAGRELWKQITPGAASRLRLPPLSQETAKDYTGYVVEMVTVSGQHRLISWSSRAHSQPASGWGAWAVGQDVTEYHRNQLRLRLLEHASQGNDHGIWILDEHMNTLYVNQAMSGMLEATRKELHESTPLDYVPEQMRRRVTALLRESEGEMETQIRTTSGKQIWVHKRVAWTSEKESRPRGLLVVMERLKE